MQVLFKFFLAAFSKYFVLKTFILFTAVIIFALSKIRFLFYIVCNI